MKKLFMFVLVLTLLGSTMFASCDVVPGDPSSLDQTDNPITMPPTTASPTPTNSATPTTTDNNDDVGGDWTFGPYRRMYYGMSVFFYRLVGEEVFYEWMVSRPWEEYYNECIAVSFVKHFNIPKEDFERANNETRDFWVTNGFDIENNPVCEMYDVDLIYTFDNELINEYFLWENGPYEDPRPALTTSATPTPPDNREDVDGGWTFGIYRPMYYNMSTYFSRLVGDKVFHEWQISRSWEEYYNECIAVSFVKHFNIPKGDFEKANNEARVFLVANGYDIENNPKYEIYDVDLIYTLDNELINEYFLWENGSYEEPR